MSTCIRKHVCCVLGAGLHHESTCTAAVQPTYTETHSVESPALHMTLGLCIMTVTVLLIRSSLGAHWMSHVNLAEASVLSMFNNVVVCRPAAICKEVCM